MTNNWHLITKYFCLAFNFDFGIQLCESPPSLSSFVSAVSVGWLTNSALMLLLIFRLADEPTKASGPLYVPLVMVGLRLDIGRILVYEWKCKKNH